MKRILFALLLFQFIACSAKKQTLEPELSFSTSSDSCLHYYNYGWHQIMDLGDYSGAEVSYRKALIFDPDFLLGQSVLARLTTDLDERLELFDNLEAKKGQVKGGERLILDVYLSLTEYTNLRDQDDPEIEEARDEAYNIGETNLKKIVHQYPKEVYLKAEYIEVLHSLYGSTIALDSMNALMTPDQEDNPFLLGYTAIMLAELEQYDEALIYAKKLGENEELSHTAKPDAILADIYFKKQVLDTAKFHADKANAIDPRNLDASRLKDKIDRALKAAE